MIEIRFPWLHLRQGVRKFEKGVHAMNKVIIKDDSYFKELVRELGDERRALAIEEPQTDFEAVIRKWKESRERARQGKTYRFLIVVEPENEHYHAYCPAVGDFHSRGKTVEEAKANLVEELQHYLTDLARRGETLPIENASVELIEISLPA
jgi:predicted RNase H-like HicB family nuclease